jgi:short-subunit dehydrogenase
VHTEFQEVARRPSRRLESGPEFVHVPVEQVVRDALAALEADRPLVIPGLPMKIGMFLVRLTPMPILRWASRFSKL